MGFFGPSKEEKQRMEEEKARQARQEELRRGVDLVYSASVPFDYEILNPGTWSWCQSTNLSEAIKSCENSLRDCAINYNAHIVIDVKVVIVNCGQTRENGHQYALQEVFMSGVVIKRLN